MTGHRDIPDEVVKRARFYDAGHHFGEDGGSWIAAPPAQVRRLLWGALEEWRRRGLMLVEVADESRPAAFFDERDLAVIGMYEDRSEKE